MWQIKYASSVLTDAMAFAGKSAKIGLLNFPVNSISPVSTATGSNLSPRFEILKYILHF